LARRLRLSAGRAGRWALDRRRRVDVGLSDRAGLQGRGGLYPVRAGVVVPAAGPDGQDMTPRRILQLVLIALVLVYPLLAADSPVYGRLGALVLLAAIGASAWNIVGGYAGQVSVGHAVFFGIGAYSAVTSFVHLGLPPISGAPVGMALSVLVAAV